MAQKSKSADATKDTDLWRIKYEDEDYLLARTDLTVGVLRQMKQWFGPAYGKYLSYVQLLIEGDADAWACAIWIVLRAAGKKSKTPQNLDFSVSEVMAGWGDEADDDDDEDDDDSGDYLTVEVDDDDGVVDVESGPTVGSDAPEPTHV
jgi:hypothetical protein